MALLLGSWRAPGAGLEVSWGVLQPSWGRLGGSWMELIRCCDVFPQMQDDPRPAHAGHEDRDGGVEGLCARGGPRGPEPRRGPEDQALLEDFQGRNCLTDFHSMIFTRDKLCLLIRKWHRTPRRRRLHHADGRHRLRRSGTAAESSAPGGSEAESSAPGGAGAASPSSTIS